jgi:hypothetical protein
MTPEQISEGERLLAAHDAAQKALVPTVYDDTWTERQDKAHMAMAAWENWLEANAPALLTAARRSVSPPSGALGERIAELRKLHSVWLVTEDEDDIIEFANAAGDALPELLDAAGEVERLRAIETAARQVLNGASGHYMNAEDMWVLASALGMYDDPPRQPLDTDGEGS